MKKPLNYVVQYRIVTNNSSQPELIDELYVTKRSALIRYLAILDGNIFPRSGAGSISELKVYRTFKSGPAEDITATINRFIEG